MKRHYCTYFDRNYLFRGLALIESLQRCSTDDFTMYVVCMDELTSTVLDSLDLPQIVTVPIREIEQGDTALLQSKTNRSAVEYLWTCTPTIILRLLERSPDAECLTYLDADMYFFSSPAPIFEQLGSNSVLIHAHNFPYPNREEVKWGKYNVGMLTFRRDERGMRVLNWWRERCIEWCYARLEDGKYGDQRYLDSWPEQFEGVAVSTHHGIGTAPWNHANYRFNRDDRGSVRVDADPIVFYHFHSLKIVSQDCIIPFGFEAYPVTREVLEHCVLTYLDALGAAMRQVWTKYPDFQHGYFQTAALDPALAIVGSHELISAVMAQSLIHQRTDLSPRWACCHTRPFRNQDELVRESAAPQVAPCICP